MNLPNSPRPSLEQVIGLVQERATLRRKQHLAGRRLTSQTKIKDPADLALLDDLVVAAELVDLAAQWRRFLLEELRDREVTIRAASLYGGVTESLVRHAYRSDEGAESDRVRSGIHGLLRGDDRGDSGGGEGVAGPDRGDEGGCGDSSPQGVLTP